MPLEEVDNDDKEWKQMDAFHMIVTEAFHPYNDSTNIEPAKQLAEKLVSEAKKLAASPLPEQINNEVMKEKLNQLEADVRSFAALVQGDASDEEIGASLTALHSSFHSVMEVWTEHQH